MHMHVRNKNPTSKVDIFFLSNIFQDFVETDLPFPSSDRETRAERSGVMTFNGTSCAT